jgi:hypothetical protein
MTPAFQMTPAAHEQNAMSADAFATFFCFLGKLLQPPQVPAQPQQPQQAYTPTAPPAASSNSPAGQEKPSAGQQAQGLG